MRQVESYLEGFGHGGPGVYLGDGKTEACLKDMGMTGLASVWTIYLKDKGMTGLASVWTMARRRPI